VRNLITRFMELWQRLKRSLTPTKPESTKVERLSEVSDEYTLEVDFASWLKALEELRVHVPDAYDHCLQYLKRQLSRARRVTLFNAASTRDFICNASVAQQTRCRTLEGLIDDMEKTTDKLDRKENTVIDDVIPAALQAGR